MKGGSICCKDGNIAYMYPVRGSKKRVRLLDCPSGWKKVGIYHIHPFNYNEYDDRPEGTFSVSDLAGAIAHKAPVYLKDAIINDDGSLTYEDFKITIEDAPQTINELSKREKSHTLL